MAKSPDYLSRVFDIPARKPAWNATRRSFSRCALWRLRQFRM